MRDGIGDFAFDFCSNDCGHKSRMLLILKLLILYLLLAFACVMEMRFRTEGIELVANVETVGETDKGRMRVRLNFHDPITGHSRINTVCVHKDRVPTGATALIEYIPGDYPTSRLKAQSNPQSISLFCGLNIIFTMLLAGLLGYIVYEAHGPIPQSPARANRTKKTDRIRIAAS